MRLGHLIYIVLISAEPQLTADKQEIMMTKSLIQIPDKYLMFNSLPKKFPELLEFMSMLYTEKKKL